MNRLHEFRSRTQNKVRDAILAELADGPVGKQVLLGIGESWGMYEGELNGILSTLHRTGAIASAGQGYWKLPDEKANR